MCRLRFAPICILLTPAFLGAQPLADRPATLTHLYSLLTPNGGYLANTPQPNVRMQPTLGSTLGALRAIKYNGGEPRHLDASARFIASCHDPKTGGFGNTPGAEPTVATTAVGIMAVVELKMPIDKYRDGAVGFVTGEAKTLDDFRIAAAMFESLGQRSPKADQWLAEVAKMQKPDGTFGDARQTGGTAAMILRLGGKIANREAVLRVMRSGQRADGGFGTAEKPDSSDLESCYRIVRAFAMMKEKPADADKLRAFIARCRNADGGYGVEPGQRSSVSGTYFAALITHWLAQP